MYNPYEKQKTKVELVKKGKPSKEIINNEYTWDDSDSILIDLNEAPKIINK